MLWFTVHQLSSDSKQDFMSRWRLQFLFRTKAIYLF